MCLFVRNVFPFTKSQDMPADESYLVGTTQTAFLLAELGADDGNETSVYASQDRRVSMNQLFM